MSVIGIGFGILCTFLTPLLLCAGFLQAYLSKRESWVPGLIIPVMCFILSILMCLGMLLSENPLAIIWVLVIFLLVNTPTCVYLTIYCVCREKIHRQKQTVY